ncbi:hybrid sensor histidine kinase/response regulator [Laspinema olomoucense]|uniref:hybrid sensor histidine kinase/response regulator n=1 Tax=Laspinema olomoucense TaxID=3231600 RepID=UPI0021BA6646|nr:hybrid sensor histidine kinase/response regulator [Laspinema sp. D3a]MCT7991496.1 hybrid sensor histidine kinase/response regulator [Laspinema sp. D3a]
MDKILVIDDDSATRLLLKRDLKLEGHEVTVAKDGEEGVKLALELQPALIICDWVMPYFDGVEVCRIIKSNPELAPTFFILLTSKVDLEDRIQGLDAGADDFLSKPVNPAELLARVRAGLRLYHSQQQLSQSNQQLSQTLRDLQQTQAQLIQSEKMSSIGQMVAGIAHEINNPVTFIDGNLNHAVKYIRELLEFIELFHKYYPNPLPEMKEAAEELDLEFLMADFPPLVESMRRGAKRIREIVESLRTFSHLDEAEIKDVDLHEGLDSTLSILKSRLEGIETQLNYGELPRVECYPSDINQVFFHLLNNAIDAVGKRSPLQNSPVDQPDSHPAPPRIRICTETRTASHAVIRIFDNGVGIPKETVTNIFNPFFTTKDVGAGKGLGLTISYQIVVDKHGGKLEVYSEPGQETEFAIIIPIHPPKKLV